MKRSIRADKRGYIDNLARQAKETAAQGNMKGLYDITRKLAGRYQQTDKPVKDKLGEPLTMVQEQLNRWTEHFSELLNRPAPEDPQIEYQQKHPYQSTARNSGKPLEN